MRLALLSGVALVAGEGATPMGKIISMLQKMFDEAKVSKAEEWKLSGLVEVECKHKIGNLEKDMQEEKDEIEDQNATILSSDATIAECRAEIDVLNADTEGNKHDMAAATAVRELESTDYKAASSDYSESILALERASQLLKSQSAEVHAPVFLQTVKDSKINNEGLKNELVSGLEAAFMQANLAQKDDGTGVAYASAVGGVIQMIDDLRQKFQAESRQINADEQKSGHAFNNLLDERVKENQNNEAQVNRKNLEKGEAQAAKEGAISTKKQAEAALADLRDLYLKTSTECKADARHFEKQQAARQEEIDALEQVIQVLSLRVSPNARNIDPTAQSFLQLSSSFDGVKQNKETQEALERGEHAINILLQAAQSSKEGSKTMEALANRLQTVSSEVASGQLAMTKKNPFSQVVNMIRGIITKINKQMVEDAATHGQCEADKATSKIEKESVQKDLNEAAAKEDQLAAQKDKLTSEIADLTESLLQLSQDRETAKELRAENKAANEKAIAECKEAIEALIEANGILKEAAKKVATAAEAAQPANAATYGGDTQGYDSILQMLSVVQLDFVKEQSEAETTEDEQADAFKELMNSTEITMARKDVQKKMREETLATTSTDLITKSSEVTNLTGRVGTARKTETAIHKRCKGGVTHEERQKQIAEEIQNLKEAKTVLEGFSATEAP